MPSILFDEEDFLYFGVNGTEATLEAINAQFHRGCLRLHLNKPSGWDDAFVMMKATYDRLRRQFDLFNLLLGENPDMTVASVMRPAHRNLHDNGNGSAAQLISSGSLLLARSYHVLDIISDNPVLLSIEDALATSMPDIFDTTLDVLAIRLRALRPGDEHTALLYGVEQPVEGWIKKYHGTSWTGLENILRDGFLPSFGAGRATAYREFGEDVPLVYTSSDAEVARTYPQGMVDQANDYCGEAVAKDTWYLRPSIICRVNPAKRRVKIREGRNMWNTQDAYLVEGVQATAVTFYAMATAPPEQIIHYDLKHENVAQTAAPSPWHVEPELRDLSIIESELMRLRRHPEDDRNHCQLRDATLELLRVRNGFLTNNHLPVKHVLDFKEMQTIWNNDLKNVFRQEENEIFSNPPPPKRPKHNRYGAWLFWTYGKKNQIIKLLKHGIQDSRLLHKMETTQWQV